ncbi:unnamed protein product [Urochloa humidicola]
MHRKAMPAPDIAEDERQEAVGGIGTDGSSGLQLCRDVFVDGLISDLAMEYLCRMVVGQLFSIFTDVFTDDLISDSGPCCEPEY